MKQLKLIIAALLVLGPLTANAGIIDLSGVVTSPTGAFAALTPPDTPLAGPMNVDDAAVLGGFAGPGDILSIDVSVGGFCFYTGAPMCPSPGSNVPITSIDAAALTFNAGLLGGTLNITAFSPTFMTAIPIFYDFDGGTFFGDGGALGTVFGTIAGTYGSVVPAPAPATLALMGLGLAGLGWKRRKA